MGRALNRGFSASSKGFPSTVNYTQQRMPSNTYNNRGYNVTTNNYGSVTNGLNGSKVNLKTGGSTGGGSRAGSSLSAAAQYLQPGNNIYDMKKQMAQDAYDRGVAALNAAYGSYMSALDDNLSSTKGALLDAYKRSKKSIMDDSRSSLKQAYINKVLSEKNLAQQMSAQGLSGGATETTRASMSNNYGNARNNINTTTNNNLSSLEGEYNQNLADAMQAYNMAVANAQLQKAQQLMALEEALANNQIAALDDFNGLMAEDNEQYLAALQGAIDNSGQFEMTPTEAINKVRAPEILQNDNSALRTSNNLQAALEAMGEGFDRGYPSTRSPYNSNPNLLNLLLSNYSKNAYTPPYSTGAKLANSLSNFRNTMPTTQAPLSNAAAISNSLANFYKNYR